MYSQYALPLLYLVARDYSGGRQLTISMVARQLPMGMIEDVGDAQAEAERWNSKGKSELVHVRRDHNESTLRKSRCCSVSVAFSVAVAEKGRALARQAARLCLTGSDTCRAHGPLSCSKQPFDVHSPGLRGGAIDCPQPPHERCRLCAL